MTTRSMYSIDRRLFMAQVAIDGARTNSDILAILDIFGYNLVRLDAAKALYEEASTLVSQRHVKYGEQYEASEMFKTAWNAARAAYMRALKIARIAFKGNQTAHTALMLGGKRKQALAGWLEQATVFYANLLSDANLMAAMGSFGYDRGKLEGDQELVQAVVTANLVLEKKKGEAREATRQRNAKLHELDVWMSDFKVVTFIAMEENPQWLEKLGFVVP